MDFIRQAVKPRKDLSMGIWPNHNIEEKDEEHEASEVQKDYTAPTT